MQFQAVDAGLRDSHPYVREAAVMGVLKCHHQDAAGVRMRGLLDRVEALLAGDGDPQVVANCLYVMQQVGGAAGGARVPRQRARTALAAAAGLCCTVLASQCV